MIIAQLLEYLPGIVTSWVPLSMAVYTCNPNTQREEDLVLKIFLSYTANLRTA